MLYAGPPMGSIPVFITDEYDGIAIVQMPETFPSLYLAPLFGSRLGKCKPPPTKPAIVGSVTAFGAVFACHLAQAYAPVEASADVWGRSLLWRNYEE